MISHDAIDQIRDKLDIVELVREYAPGLKKAGRSYKACCPFHQERTPSFTVNPEKQLWYCFGACHDGGDAFKFLMRAESLSFVEAAQRLADRTGVQWKPAAETLGPRERERQECLDALERAKEFYRKVLETSPEADTARKYFERRGVTAETREKFELGYAPPDGTSLLDAATKKGLRPQILQKAGLLSEREGGKYRDYFRSRVLFPIRDSRGAVVGFGGRTLGDAEPKYLNTPETPVFNKSRTLYGLFTAGPAIRKGGKAMLVEGYMDAIACHQHGLGIAVAPLGTSVTPDHAQLIRRYAEEVLVLFDADNAGLTAAVRGADILLEAGLQVRIGGVPNGKDPDEFLKANGAKALEDALKDASDLASFQTELELRRAPPRSLEDKAKIAAKVLETIGKQPNAILRDEWFRRLATRLALSEDALRDEERRIKRGAKQTYARTQKAAAVSNEPEIPEVEKNIVMLVLKHPELFESTRGLSPESFRSERAREAWTAILAAPKDGNWPSKLGAGEGIGPWIAGLLLGRDEFNAPEEQLKKFLGDFEKHGRDERRFRELEVLLQKGQATPEQLQEFMGLAKKTRGTTGAAKA